MYKLYKSFVTNKIADVIKENSNGHILCIPFDPANTDYANFKTAILEDKAQLQDADGNTMTAEQAKDFIKELP
jgi:hypothetical protein